MAPIKVKICGITEENAALIASENSAAFLGFVSFEKSPRHLTINAAKNLEPLLPDGPDRVGVFVNASAAHIALFADALKLDYAQLHGSETLEDIRIIKKLTGLKIIKALPLSSEKDLETAAAFYDCVDALLFDAPPPEGSSLPGGNHTAFDWKLLQHFACPVPWFLAGGLTPENVAAAIDCSGAAYLDVSSGVESAPGIKDPDKITNFLQAAHSAQTV